MNIASAATAFPRHYYPQKVLTAALREYWLPLLPEPRVVDRLHAHARVEGRHLVMPMEAYYDVTTFGRANDIWIEAAQDLGECALRSALCRAHVEPRDLGALFFVSITGISSPSIEGRLVNRMGLSPNIRRIPIFGLGCVGGAAGLARAADYVRAYPEQVAAVLSVEICSLTLQHDDLTVANLVSSGLFGDGCATVLVAGSDRHLPGPQIIDTRSVFYPDTEDVMGWDISEKGFRIVLSKEVPEMARKHLRQDTDEFLAAHGLSRADMRRWILHTGGPKVLEAMEEALELKNGEIALSWENLRKNGNLSSASVLAVLEDVLAEEPPAPGSYGLLAAMGPGFCAELVLLRW